jgi:hypothetical protein
VFAARHYDRDRPNWARRWRAVEPVARADPGSKPSAPRDGSAAPTRRPFVSFISWSEDDGRALEIAAALGGEARIFYDLRIVWRPLVPLRYAVSGIRMVFYLLVRRPRSVIVTNPPIFPALIALAYGRLARAPIVLDSHPSAFGPRGMHAFEPLHSWVALRAVTTLVTVDELGEIVRRWGARADIVHEAPPKWSVPPAPPFPDRPRVLYVGRFAGDEPTAEVLDAARFAPEIDLYVTGDVRKCPAELVDAAPSNVKFTGFLRDKAYVQEIARANVILVLTSRADAVNRAAYEAVYAGRALVVTSSLPMTQLFPFAIHVTNDAQGIASGLRTAVRRYVELVEAAPAALTLQDERWLHQLSVLRSRLASGNAGRSSPLSEGAEGAYTE